MGLVLFRYATLQFKNAPTIQWELLQDSSYVENGPPFVVDLLVVAFGTITMVIRTVSYWKSRNSLKQLMLDISKMAKKRGVRWSNQLKLGLLLVLAEVSIFFTCDFLASILSITSNAYWFFNYATMFIIGFIENYFHFELQSAIRRVFASINSGLQEQIGNNKSTERCIRNIVKCTQDHFVMVRIAKRINEVFGLEMASWFAFNFFQLTGEINYCWYCSKKMMTTGKFVPKAFTSATWIVLLISNFVFLVGSWHRTFEEVSSYPKSKLTLLQGCHEVVDGNGKTFNKIFLGNCATL